MHRIADGVMHGVQVAGIAVVQAATRVDPDPNPAAAAVVDSAAQHMVTAAPDCGAARSGTTRHAAFLSLGHAASRQCEPERWLQLVFAIIPEVHQPVELLRPITIVHSFRDHTERADIDAF